ncbi:PDZ domain-containing protein [Aphelenchoides avenae]|nr:PDZ domain-containing protein [Aphelenchus avenae]
MAATSQNSAGPSSTSHSERVDEGIPPNREKNVQRRPGYGYHLVRLDFHKGCKVGLGIKQLQNKVFVSRIDDGSICSKALIAGDRIIDVNGEPVSDKDVARTMLVKSLAKTKTVSLLIERLVSEAARKEMNFAINAMTPHPLAEQAREIAIRDDSEGNKHVKEDGGPKNDSGAPKKP